MNAVPRVVSTSAVAALVLTTVWLFWPSALGGATTYVTTHGTSMEPHFHTGDLAVLTPADGYSVGDIVAYRSEALDTIVMHRIVSIEGDRFVTQGDNNDWLDEDRPTEDEILGSLSFRIPHGGQVLDAIRSPGVAFPLAGVLLVVLGALHDPRGRRTARWLRRRGARVPTLPVSTRGRARQVALGAGVVALASAVGCGVLLALPPNEVETRTLEVTQQGTYSYSGTAVTGTTYPTGTLTTGDTVWNRLVENLTVTLAGSFSGPGLADLAGSVHLDVVVSAADGWSAVVTSGAPVPLVDGAATASVAVDADQAAELLSRHGEETGTSIGTATLTVTPVTDVTGTVQGQAFTAEPLTGLAFALDGMALMPTSTDAAAFEPSLTTGVPVDEIAPRSIQVLAASIPIGTARKLVGALLLLSLVALGAGLGIGRIGRGNASDRFLVRHADRIVPVASFSPGSTVIDVADAESLHRVAERFDSVVLHQAGPDEDVFAVRDLDATYRFVVPGSARRDLPPVPAAAPAPEPVDRTTPLPRVVPGTARGSLWGQVA
ncbi:signal peptidase I [Blastococcus sp. SYSU D00922]